LPEQDRDNIRVFQLKMISNIPHAAFAQMRHAFRKKLQSNSHWDMIHRVAVLYRKARTWSAADSAKNLGSTAPRSSDDSFVTFPSFLVVTIETLRQPPEATWWLIRHAVTSGCG